MWLGIACGISCTTANLHCASFHRFSGYWHFRLPERPCPCAVWPLFATFFQCCGHPSLASVRRHIHHHDATPPPTPRVTLYVHLAPFHHSTTLRHCNDTLHRLLLHGDSTLHIDTIKIGDRRRQHLVCHSPLPHARGLLLAGMHFSHPLHIPYPHVAGHDCAHWSPVVLGNGFSVHGVCQQHVSVGIVHLLNRHRGEHFVCSHKRDVLHLGKLRIGEPARG
mmetsp:Transcript_35838/g.67560  ORF Transcript_35838/g.67560 Transcript_35838/m.67560 type:complete len:221 (+) Transcript_35838:505-1167(+)